jgi:hypothetical protein
MQAALCRRQSHGAVFASGSQRSGRCRIGSIVRAGDEQGSKVVREFREDSGEMVVPGAQKKQDNALYADQLPQAVSAACAHGPQAPCVDSAPHSASRTKQASHLYVICFAVEAKGEHLKGDEAALAPGVLRTGWRREQGEGKDTAAAKQHSCNTAR